MSEEAVLTERRGKVLLITLNRPDQMNSINGGIAAGLAAAMGELHADGDLAAGVLTGNGRGFCSGMDLKAFAKGEDISAVVDFFVNGSEKPLIAAVEGFALAGGLELALSTDLIVASAGAKFGIPEVSVGLFAGAGALLRLPRVVPYPVAMKMALTAKPITAEQALDYGMIAEVTEKGEALNAALELAAAVAKNAPLGLIASKELLREMQGRTEAEFWQYQQSQVDIVFKSEDGVEGATAFAEKRAPNWKGV